MYYLNHDGDSRIVFQTLESFEKAAHDALGTSNSLTSYHPKCAVILPNQVELSRFARDLYEDNGDFDGHWVLVTLIASMDLTDLEFLSRIAMDDDFYIGEAIGDAITNRPRVDLKALAEMVAAHRHPQAAAAGKRALVAIQRSQR